MHLLAVRGYPRSPLAVFMEHRDSRGRAPS
jgi:hypothetical protein